jgi:hypothetical protein
MCRAHRFNATEKKQKIILEGSKEKLSMGQRAIYSKTSSKAESHHVCYVLLLFRDF